jgi:hypothetical protein
MKFEHPDQRTAEVGIQQGVPIGRGSFGTVYEAVVTIGNHSRTMVLKKFRENEVGTAEENALRAFRNYSRAKEAGLKVFPTYRLGEDQESILMSDGRSGVWFCAAGNNETQPYRISTLTNLEQVVEQLTEQSILAAAADLNLREDMLFFTVQRDSKSHLDFYFGDLDLLIRSAGRNRYSTQSENLVKIQEALENFIEKYVDNPEQYLVMLKTYFSKAQRKGSDLYK